jgi:PAS domain S-box-containing protein
LALGGARKKKNNDFALGDTDGDAGAGKDTSSVSTQPDIGFLEGEFERAVAAHSETGTSNVVELNQGSPDKVRQERDRRFRGLLEALPVAIYTTDPSGRITYFNEAAAEFWGQRPQLGSSEWCGSWKLFWPDGAPLAHPDCPMALALKENRPIRGMEAVAERPDGTRIPFIPYPTPLYDQNGRLVGAVNMLVDITDRKRAEAEQAMLVREVHHRVRNTLAIAQAIVGSTAKSSDTIEGFKEALIGRISALARTHLLMSDASRTEVDFEMMLKNELEPFSDSSGMRVAMSGPPVEISSRTAVPLGMALHELTTNAAKYGALSTFGGKVEVTWRVITEAKNRHLEFDWVESGGPAVEPPARKGFGDQLLEVVLPRQISATTNVDYRADGLRVKVKLPLADIKEKRARKKS